MCEEMNERITLRFDDYTVECEILGVFVAQEREYIALVPVEDDADMYLYRYREVGDEFEIEDIDSEEEFETARDVLEAILSEDL